MPASRLKSLMINDEGFAFDPRSGHTYAINQTGLFIIDEFKTGASIDAIQQKLVRIYDVDEVCAGRDIEVFMRTLSGYKFVAQEGL